MRDTCWAPFASGQMTLRPTGVARGRVALRAIHRVGGAVGLGRVLRGGPSGFMGRPDETRPNPLRPHAAALLLGF